VHVVKKILKKRESDGKTLSFLSHRTQGCPLSKVKINREINKRGAKSHGRVARASARHGLPASVLRRLTPLSAQLSNKALSYLLDIYDG